MSQRSSSTVSPCSPNPSTPSVTTGHPPQSVFSVLGLTVCLVGIQFTWTVEFGYGTPYLLSLGLSKQWTALVWLAGPISGLIVQPWIGMVSDSSRCVWGRRRPFMLGASLILILAVWMIPHSHSVATWLVEWNPFITAKQEAIPSMNIGVAVFAFYLLDFSINAVQAMSRALIVDVTPMEQQAYANAWAGRMLGLGALLGYITGYIDLPYYLPSVGDTQLLVLCLISNTVFLVTLAVTCLSVKETVPLHPSHQQGTWYHFLWNLVKTVRTLPSPITSVLYTQVCAWFAWFPFLFYSTAWVASKVVNTDQETARYGSLALLLFSVCQCVTGSILPYLSSHDYLPSFFTLPRIWGYSLYLLTAVIWSSLLVTQIYQAILMVALCGVSFGVAVWIPFSLIGECISHYSHPFDYSPLQPSDSDSATTILVQEEDQLDAQETPYPHIEAGWILGIHNIFIVLPQFMSTLFSAVVFMLVDLVQHHFIVQPDTADAFGWVLRMGSLFGLLGGVLACRVKQVHAKV